jgi:hypothetical protein
VSHTIVLIFLIGLNLVPATLVAFSGGEAPDPVVLSVGDTKFTAAAVGKFIEAMPPAPEYRAPCPGSEEASP